jgi:intracellular sulfur oxidation DsrE/DsrF family protein
MNLLYLSSDQIGNATPELGRKLMCAFLEKVVASEVHVDFVACLNGGVFLTTDEGPALESLRTLASRGTRVLTCGTCLDHYGREETLLVGAVGGMQQTVELLATAERVIAP